MMIPRRFTAEELFPKKVIAMMPGNTVWSLMDDRLLKTLDRISDICGPTWCNNWHLGGKLDSCGFRPPWDTDGARLSAHYRGMAADPKFACTTVTSLEGYMKAKPDRFPDIEYTKRMIQWAKRQGIKLTVVMMREWILANPVDFPHIRAIEIRDEWMHIDTRNCDPILKIYD